MTNLSYLTRRSGGSFYVQIRVTAFTGNRSLLRFSLRTASYAEAKPRLFAYLRWLLPMQSPAEIEENIDLILSQIDDFLKEGLAEDIWQAHHRHHYLKTATALLVDWRKAEPCPIRYARFYSRQRQFAQALTALGSLIGEDLDHHQIALPDPDYLKRPEPQYKYVCDENDIVAEVLEEDGPASWPRIPHYLMPDHLAVRPPYCIGDAWGKPSASRVVPAQSRNDRVSGVSGSDHVAVKPARPIGADLSPHGDGSAPKMSELLVKFLAEHREETDEATAERDVKPYVLFAIHIMTDQPIAAYTRDQIRGLCLAMTRIPHPQGMQAKSPVERYEFANQHGWKGLKPISETTIANRYICGLKRFWGWTKETGYYKGDLPAFKLMGKKNTGALGRDSFNKEEIQALFSMPTFVGHMRHSRNLQGPVLRQDHIYWSYIIMNLTGMRPAEIAQLEIDDLMLVPDQGIWYFDLRPFDPAKGRVVREDMKIFKTEAASRMVPVHPALFELGLLDRANKLEKLGHTRLFPDCKPKVLNGTDLKWGHALAKDWQTRKSHVTTRAHVSAYSGRHSMTDLLRELGITPHDCEKFLGHSHPGVNGKYGRKGLMPDKVVDAFVNMDAPIVRWLRQHLVTARDAIEADGMLIEDWSVKPKPQLF